MTLYCVGNRLGSSPGDSQDLFPALPQAHWGTLPPSQPHLQDKEAAHDNPPVNSELLTRDPQENQGIDGGCWATRAWPSPAPRCDTTRLSARSSAKHPPLSPKELYQNSRSRLSDHAISLFSSQHPAALPWLFSKARSWVPSCSPPAPSTSSQHSCCEGRAGAAVPTYLSASSAPDLRPCNPQ